ncbi:MAG: hypothetical protein ACRD6N_14980 [Pyrinomonadaceae bacterium]
MLIVSWKHSTSLRSRRQHEAQGEAQRTLGKDVLFVRQPARAGGSCYEANALPPVSRAATNGCGVTQGSLRFTLGFMLPPAPQAG